MDLIDKAVFKRCSNGHYYDVKSFTNQQLISTCLFALKNTRHAPSSSSWLVKDHVIFYAWKYLSRPRDESSPEFISQNKLINLVGYEQRRNVIITSIDEIVFDLYSDATQPKTDFLTIDVCELRRKCIDVICTEFMKFEIVVDDRNDNDADGDADKLLRNLRCARFGLYFHAMVMSLLICDKYKYFPVCWPFIRYVTIRDTINNKTLLGFYGKKINAKIKVTFASLALDKTLRYEIIRLWRW